MVRISESEFSTEKTDEELLDCYEFIMQNHSGTLQVQDDELAPYAGILNAICLGVDISDFAIEEEMCW